MKKKIILLVCVALVLATVVYSLCTKGLFTNHIYFPQNVYEEIWNMLVSEEQGKPTVLSTGTEEAEVVWSDDPHTGGWDGKTFGCVRYPESEKRIGWRGSHGTTELLTFVFYENWPEETETEFGYDCKTKTLYGTKEEAWIAEHFFKDYFQWCEENEDFSSSFSIDDLGDFRYQKVELLYYVLHTDRYR